MRLETPEHRIPGRIEAHHRSRKRRLIFLQALHPHPNCANTRSNFAGANRFRNVLKQDVLPRTA